MMKDLVLITNWEKVDKDDFYLSSNWKNNTNVESMKRAKKLQQENNLFYGYIVEARSLRLYSQMDSTQVLIDKKYNVIMHCEDTIIDDSYIGYKEYEY